MGLCFPTAGKDMQSHRAAGRSGFGGIVWPLVAGLGAALIPGRAGDLKYLESWLRISSTVPEEIEPNGLKNGKPGFGTHLE